MQTSQKWLLRFAATALLLLLVVGGAKLFNTGLLAPQTTQENANPVVMAQETPVATLDATPPPVVIIGTVEPTPTTIPTPTPRPTPTQRPGPTAEPYPTKAPAKDAAGTVSFVSFDDKNFSSVKQFTVNAQGEKEGETINLPAPVDFPISKIMPSPDGKYLLLQQPAMPGGIPHVFDTQSQKTWLLLPNHPSLPGIVFAWHPNSQQVLFWSLDAAFWLVNVETGDAITLNVIDGPVQGAAISPDGQAVIYIAKSDVAYNALWKVSTAGGDAKPLLQFGGSAYLFGWSPDGKQILYMGGPGVDAEETVDPNAAGPMWLVDVDGQNPRALAGPLLTGWAYEPVWSPDSQKIAFVGLEEGTEYGCAQKGVELNWQTCRFKGTAIYVENISNGEVKRLADGINPVWSPDSSYIAFLSNQSGASEIWRVSLTDGASRQLTTDSQAKSQVVWVANWGQ